MTLEKQVISLSLAKRLKELGGKQESIFGWLLYNNGESELVHFYDGVLIPPTNYAAFTVAELGEMLPATIPHLSRRHDFAVEKYENCWDVGYQNGGKWASLLSNNGNFVQRAHTEAEARGLMLAYLLENNLMSV